MRQRIEQAVASPSASPTGSCAACARCGRAFSRPESLRNVRIRETLPPCLPRADVVGAPVVACSIAVFHMHTCSPLLRRRQRPGEERWQDTVSTLLGAVQRRRFSFGGMPRVQILRFR